jgi:hypothetical protein
MPRYGAGVRVGAGGQVARYARPDGANARVGGYRYGGERRHAGALGYGYYPPLDYGWLDANDAGDGAGYYDDGSGDESGYGGAAADDGSGVAADGEQPAAEYAPSPQGYGPQGYGPAGYAPAMVPYPQQPPAQYAERAPVEAAPVQAVTPAVENADAVTLVFKDGRPAEKVHNYALTRTMVYVTDGRRREIPVAALDLTATEKANREAGVDFQLPVAR